MTLFTSPTMTAAALPQPRRILEAGCRTARAVVDALAALLASPWRGDIADLDPRRRSPAERDKQARLERLCIYETSRLL